MHAKSSSFAELRELRDFSRLINRPKLGGVGQAQHPRLRAMHLEETGEHFLHGAHIDFTVRSIYEVNLESRIQKARGVALMFLDMREPVADHAVVSFTYSSKCKRVGCGPA
jgi:hypothetical protein